MSSAVLGENFTCVSFKPLTVAIELLALLLGSSNFDGISYFNDFDRR
jgi:hypothetical protein